MKIENIAPYLQNRLADFDEILHGDTLMFRTLVAVQKFKFFTGFTFKSGD